MPRSEECQRSEFAQLLCEQAATARAVRERPGGPDKWLGYMVKKGFPQIAERSLREEFMWVRVTGVRGDRLVGRLANSPAFATYLAFGDEVEFGEDEVCGAEWPRPTNATDER